MVILLSQKLTTFIVSLKNRKVPVLMRIDEVEISLAKIFLIFSLYVILCARNIDIRCHSDPNYFMVV